MIRPNRVFPSLLLLSMLGGCGQSPDTPLAVTNQSAEKVADAMSKVRLEPGEWEATQEVVDIQITGAPKGMPADAMKSAIGRKTTVKHCVTPEQAAKPSADFLAAQKDSKCTYSNFAMEGGTIHGSVTCPGGQGGKMIASMLGTYASDHYDMAMTMNMDGMQPGMAMAMKMKTSGKRIGECPSGDTAK
jgi:Protein of unknown function (DUF3617)